jgi:Amt family ammonium transporter
MPLTASDDQQATGMDLLEHGEDAYPSGEGAILIEPDGAARAGSSQGEPAFVSNPA